MPSETARRVAQRFTASQGESLVDLLADYHAKLKAFERYEGSARAMLSTYEELQAIRWKVPAQEEKIKELVDRIPMAGDQGAIKVASALIQEFPSVSMAGSAFCVVALQTVVLSPKLRKSIEVASRFWDKKVTYKGGTFDRVLAVVQAYVDTLEKLRKYEALFTLVVKEGKAHGAEGEAATKVKAGPFTIVNTADFPAEVVAEKVKICEEAADRLKRIGLGVVCYGDVLITNRLTVKGTVAASYLPSKDILLVRADAGASIGTVRHVCHELAHRFDFKFMRDRSQVKALYDTIKGAKQVPKPKKGVRVQDGDRLYVVTAVSRDAILVTGENGKIRVLSHPEYKNLVAPEGYHFVSHYAEDAGPTENFAEMVSYMALGHLPAQQVKLLEPLLR